jgi:hypothetical protein
VLAAPRWKGTTPAAAEDAADPAPPVGCTVTCVAVMVVPLVVPSTRTGWPVVTALAEAELVPFRYVVVDASLTVTFWPADVDRVKLDVDTPVTVPDVPPAAGPERALDAPPAAAPLLGAGAVEVAEGGVAVADEDDGAQPAASPTTVAVTAAATIHPFLLFDRNRRTPGRRMGTEADESGAAPAPAELPALGGPDIALGTAPGGTGSWGLVGSYSFMMALLSGSGTCTESASRACEVLVCGL